MYDRKLDVDNEQTEQVDEKKKSSPLKFLTEINRLLFAEVECLSLDTFVSQGAAWTSSKNFTMHGLLSSFSNDHLRSTSLIV